MMASRRLRLSADIGGTFTDVAAFDEVSGELMLGKALTTPRDLVEGIVLGVTKAGTTFRDARIFLHGSTVVINTLLERTGARTALVITEGFRDIYEIGRVNRPDAYNLFFRKHVPLVPRELRREARERILADGSVERPLDEPALHALADELAGAEVEGVAVVFLHCYRNPSHELRAKEILASRLPGCFVTASHELSQEYREFERCSTAVANAYVGPRVSRYLDRLGERLRDAGFSGSFLVVQSTGGLFDMQEARRECIRMLESGPAAGVIGTQALCAQLGMRKAIAFDMGGTTAKAGVILDGQPLTTGAALIGGYAEALPVQIAMMDIFEVGTGGGSLARVSAAGALSVGPQSAGAEPGPACYGRGGTEPTVTDANVLLGRLTPERFLGGEMPLDLEAAQRVMRARVADPLGVSVTDASDGVLRIAVTKMSYAVKAVTTERGLDAGQFALFAYGGAGPLHATAVARELAIRRVVIPRAPGHFSAFGMLFSDLRHDAVRTCFLPLTDVAFEKFDRLYAAMEDEGRARAVATGIGSDSLVVVRAADMRYVGQEHAVTVPLAPELFQNQDHRGMKGRFDEVHHQRYGTFAADEPAEIVSVRSTVFGTLAKPPLAPIRAGGPLPPAEASTGTRQVYFRESGAFVPTPAYSRAALASGNRIQGPALIEEHASTTVVMPGDRLEIDLLGNLVIEVGR